MLSGFFNGGIMLYQIPSHKDLVYFWVKAHFPDQPAAIFFDPLGDGNRIQDIANFLNLDDKKIGSLINADIFVLPMDKETLINFVNDLDQDVYGYVEAWDGLEIVTHN
jgi:hypothetical protein